MSELVKDLINQGYRYAYSLTHSPVLAEDIVHDAWLSIVKNNSSQSKAYFFTCIRNRYFNIYKREKLVPVISLDDTLDDAELTDSDNQFEAIIADQDLLNHGLNQLRPIEREIIFLYYFEELSTSEIADHTELNKGTVCSLIHRSREKLKMLLSQSAEQVVAP